MSKDKIYGYGIFFLTIILLILYVLYVPVQQYFGQMVGTVEGPLYDFVSSESGILNPLHVTVIDGLLWPVFLATLMIGFIIAWIGITMATTPPPEPIDLDDLNLDEEEFEEKEEKEED